MPDYGSRYTEKRQRLLELRLKRIYTEAQKDLQEKLDSFVAKKERKQQEKLAQKKAGLITEQEYKDWLSGQVFIEKQWKAKVQQATDILYHSNEKAVSMVRDEQMNVFTENANYQAYQVEKTTGFQNGVSFELYDMATVDRLINEKPELLPRSNLKERKDRAWNQGIIANTITQGIIQGATIPQIARRIAKDTASRNTKAMIRYARTAITGAENAGRMETMRRAEDMGINVKKQWLATLDRRTRDSHRHLDGQIRKIDEPFESELGEIMYPGDPEAEPGDVYNCRCTLTYIYPDYPSPASERIAYDEWEDEEGSHRESFIMGQDTNYGDWLLEKKRRYEERISSDPKQATALNAFSTKLDDIGWNYQMKKEIIEILDELPMEKAIMYANGINSAPINITNTYPDGTDIGLSHYSPQNDQVYIREDETGGWVAVHETTHYRNAHTPVEDDLVLTGRRRKRDNTGAVIRDENGRAVYEEVKEIYHETFTTVSSWASSKYDDKKLQEDRQIFLQTIGASEEMTNKEMEYKYVAWMQKFRKENDIIFSDYCNFNDIVDAFTTGDWNGLTIFGGHGKDYWKNRDIVMNEVIANYSTMDALQLNPLLKVFDDMMHNLAYIAKEGAKKIWE